jgi:beta-glucanase (GH16 family)
MTTSAQQKHSVPGTPTHSRTGGRITKSALTLGGVSLILGAVLAATMVQAGSTQPGAVVTPPVASTPNLPALDAQTKQVLNNLSSSVSSVVSPQPATTPNQPTTTTTPTTTPPPATSATGPGNQSTGGGSLAPSAGVVSNLPSVSDGKSDCGGVTLTKANGTPWVCTFDDEFDGTTLNTNNWLVQQTSASGYSSGNECYVNSPDNVSVSGGVLNLTAREEDASFTCSSPKGSYSTQYTSGMVSTDYRFNQTYGLYQVRAKLPASTVQGLQETFWLWPADSTKYGDLWPDSGEIDFAEFYSEYPTLDIPVVHYRSATKDPNATGDCAISDPTAFHTYGLEWTPTTMSILLDGQVCLTDSWHAMAPESGSEPFDQPFFLCLTQALGMDTNNFQAGVSQLPATTQIDWVRIWS